MLPCGDGSSSLNVCAGSVACVPIVAQMVPAISAVTSNKYGTECDRVLTLR